MDSVMEERRRMRSDAAHVGFAESIPRASPSPGTTPACARLATCRFNLSDGVAWKPMDRDIR